MAALGPVVSGVVIGFGLFVACLGAAGLASPSALLDLVTRAQTRMGLYGIAALRLAVGAALLLAAPRGRAPLLLQVVGVLALVSGAITPLFGVERFRAILDWFRRRSPGWVRGWSLCVLGFGLGLVWAVLPAG